MTIIDTIQYNTKTHKYMHKRTTHIENGNMCAKVQYTSVGAQGTSGRQ